MDHQIVTRYLGLDSNPFTPATAEEGYFPTPQTQRIIRELHFGIVSRKGFLLLLGEVGVGKTSLLLQLLGTLHQEEGLHTAWIFNTSVDRLDLLKAIITDFELDVPPNASLSVLLHKLHRHFLRVNEAGGNCAIIVDEAHNLSEEALESLRMLSNLEGRGRKLVQLLLAGQSELGNLLNTTRLRQLQSRIYLQCTLQPLSKREIHPYCSFKLSLAGAQLPFRRGAIHLLWRATRGNTRALDLIMDRALHAMAVQETHTVSSRIISRALREIAPQQRLIRKNLLRSRTRRATGLVAAAAVLLLASGTYFPSLTNPLSEADSRLPLKIFGEPSGADSGPQDKESVNNASRRSLGTMEEKAASQALSPSEKEKKKLLQFLRAFNMVDKLPALRKSVAEADIQHFRRQLPPELRLVGLDRLPDMAGLTISRLPWRELTGRDPKWYLLWDPVLDIDLKNPKDSASSHIVVLQTILREQGFYNYRIDGKYGPKTRAALRGYQQAHGMDPEQGPNNRTLFYLCRDFRNKESPAR